MTRAPGPIYADPNPPGRKGRASSRNVSLGGRRDVVRSEESGPVVLRPRAHLGTGPDPRTPYRHGLSGPYLLRPQMSSGR